MIAIAYLIPTQEEWDALDNLNIITPSPIGFGERTGVVISVSSSVEIYEFSSCLGGLDSIKNVQEAPTLKDFIAKYVEILLRDYPLCLIFS